MKQIRIGILLVVFAIFCITVVALSARSQFLDWLLTEPVQIEGSTHHFLISYPVAQNDGTIMFKPGSYTENSTDYGTMLLTPTQVANFNNIIEANETSFHSVAINGWIAGRVKIDIRDGKKIIEVYRRSLGRYHRDYVGEYELIDNKMILRNADCKYIIIDRILIIILTLFISFFLGIVYILIGVKNMIWPSPKPYSYLESPFDR